MSAYTLTDFRGTSCHCARRQGHHFVHSEALREGCDFVVDLGTNIRSAHRPVVTLRELAALMPQLPAGTTLHLKTDVLQGFVTDLLPSLRRPVVLVTGDSDIAPVVEHRALLEHPLIAHWFAQNCDLPEAHSRLTRIPIGLDNPVFNKLDKRLGFFLSMLLGRSPLDATGTRNDMGDQETIQRIASSLPATAERPARALCTFHQNQRFLRPDLRSVPERAAAFAELSHQTHCHFIDRRITQRACWQLHGNFAFEVSPPGNGLDCFRTWEALVLGTVPIVKTSPLDRLYLEENLPVVIVNSWGEITASALERWQQEKAPKFDSLLRQRLTAEHWLAKIKRAAAAAR